MSDYRKFNEKPRPQDFKCYTVDDGGATHWFVATSPGYAVAAFAKYMADCGTERDVEEFPSFEETSDKSLGAMVYNDEDGDKRPMREVFAETVAECVKKAEEFALLATTEV